MTRGSAGTLTGLDLGGAHLKFAQLGGQGEILGAFQIPLRLWEGLEELERALAAARPQLAPVTTLAVTMTGELVDLFPDRRRGVAALAAALARLLPEARLTFFAGDRFLAPEALTGRERLVASANWRATAALCARHLEAGILVDVGSTTTDLVPFAAGRPQARGRDDRGRLAAGELVYLGVVRTPLMALADHAPFRGRLQPLMNEVFATTADVFRLLGRLPADVDLHPAADGGARTPGASARRLARMLGCDRSDAPLSSWIRLAAWFESRLLGRLEAALHLLLSRLPLAPEAPLVAAGGGDFLVPELARRLRRPWTSFPALIGAPPARARAVALTAPAVAVALLARAQQAASRASTAR